MNSNARLIISTVFQSILNISMMMVLFIMPLMYISATLHTGGPLVCHSWLKDGDVSLLIYESLCIPNLNNRRPVLSLVSICIPQDFYTHNLPFTLTSDVRIVSFRDQNPGDFLYSPTLSNWCLYNRIQKSTFIKV